MRAVLTGNQPIFLASAWHTAQFSSVSSPMMVMLVLVGASVSADGTDNADSSDNADRSENAELLMDSHVAGLRMQGYADASLSSMVRLVCKG
jgi:hypothetical protein